MLYVGLCLLNVGLVRIIVPGRDLGRFPQGRNVGRAHLPERYVVLKQPVDLVHTLVLQVRQEAVQRYS